METNCQKAKLWIKFLSQWYVYYLLRQPITWYLFKTPCSYHFPWQSKENLYERNHGEENQNVLISLRWSALSQRIPIDWLIDYLNNHSFLINRPSKLWASTKRSKIILNWATDNKITNYFHSRFTNKSENAIRIKNDRSIVLGTDFG